MDYFQEVDFPIWNFGENGTDSEDYGFKFKAGNKWYEMLVKVQRKGEVMFGFDWEARVIERFCKYNIFWRLKDHHFDSDTQSMALMVGECPNGNIDIEMEKIKNEYK